MDDDKSFIEKTIDAVKHIAEVASDAAKQVMEPPEPLKPEDEVVIMPTATDGMMGDIMMPPFVVIPKKAARKSTTLDMSGRTTPTYDFPAPTSKMPVKNKTPKNKPIAAAKPKSLQRRP